MNIELSGMDALVTKLGKLRSQVSGPGTVKAVRAGARVIREAMKANAPVRVDPKTPGSTSLEPGALREGIRVYVPASETPTTALIGPSAKVEHVARFVEYGHRQVSGGYSKVTANGKVRGPGKVSSVDVPAHPFLRPAFEASVEAAEAAMVQSYSETIQEQVK